MKIRRKDLPNKREEAKEWKENGNQFLQQDKFSQAPGCYDTVIKIGPQYTGACNSRGIALGSLGLYDDAVTSYNRVLTINPDEINVKENCERIQRLMQG